MGIYFLRIREKTFSLISSTLLLLSSNVKVSNVVVKKINKLCKVKTSLSKTNRANVFGNKNVKKKKKKKKNQLRFSGCPYFENIHDRTLCRISLL